MRNKDIIGLLGSTAELLKRPSPVRSLADRMRTLPVKGLLTLERLHSEGGYLVDAEFDGCLERLFQTAMSDVDLQAIMAGLPRPCVGETKEATLPAPAVDTRADDQPTDLSATLLHTAPGDPVASVAIPDPSASRPEEARGDAALESHPVSAAFAEYREDLVKRKGPDNENVANLDSRARMFHALCGDPDVRDLTNRHIKEFAYAISYLPARVAREGRWTPDTLKQILAENGWVDRSLESNADKPSHVREPTITERTWTAKTVGPVKTAIKQYAGGHGIPLLLQDFRLHLPNHMRPAKDRDTPPLHLVDELLGYGLDDGRLVQAIIPFLAALTGRRVALLAHMRAENFAHEAGHWLAWADRDYVDENDGILKQCGVKTNESLKPFVLHEMFERCGFIDYVTRLERGWVFPSLHLAGIVDPGATVQKRMGTLTEKIQGRKDGSAERERGRKEFVFHHLRHHLLGEFRDEDLGDRLERKQVGRAPADTHGRYAYAFKPNEIIRLATRELDGLTALPRLLELDIADAAKRCLAMAEREQRRKLKHGP